MESEWMSRDDGGEGEQIIMSIAVQDSANPPQVTVVNQPMEVEEYMPPLEVTRQPGPSSPGVHTSQPGLHTSSEQQDRPAGLPPSSIQQGTSRVETQVNTEPIAAHSGSLPVPGTKELTSQTVVVDVHCPAIPKPDHSNPESDTPICKVAHVTSKLEPKSPKEEDDPEQITQDITENMTFSEPSESQEQASTVNQIQEQFTKLKSEILQEGEQTEYVGMEEKELPIKTKNQKRFKYHDPNHTVHLAQFAASMRLENKLTDVSVCCGGLVIMAHRLVLVAHSKVLCSIIGADQNCNYISLDHLSIPGEVASIVVDYIYTGVVEITQEEKPLVIEAAKALDIPHLVATLEKQPPKGKRGRPRKVVTHPPLTKTRRARAAAALVKVNKTTVSASQKRKRGRPRKCAQPSAYVESDDDNDEVVKAEEAQSSLLQKEYEELSSLVNDEPNEDVEDNVSDNESVGDADDVDFSPKKAQITVSLKKSKVRPKRKAVTKTKGKKTAKKVAKKVNTTPRIKKEKPQLTEEEKEKKRIALEEKRNRPKPIKTPEGMYKCPMEGCPYISHTDSFIYNHIRNHSDERPFPCTMCEKRFKMKKHLEVHIRVHTGERPYKCEVCGKAFKASKHRNRHRRVHTGEKIGFCDECGKGFSSRNQLNRHIIAVHRKERPFKCEHPECKYAAADKSTLRQHMLQHTRDPNNPAAAKDILCEVCGKGFLSHNSLRLHRLAHTGEDIQCGFCDYVSKYKSAMDSHLMRRHGRTLSGKAAEKRWRCDQCVYACFTENEFNMHMMKHRGEKPHKCPICDFATVDKGTLKKHMRHHTGEMPFACKVCAKHFSSQSGLARHTRIHLGIKPHKCDQCDKCYADRKSLKAHKFTHLNIKPFECHICCYACVKKEYLLKHIEKTHGIQSIPENMRPNPEHKKYRPKSLFPPKRMTYEQLKEAANVSNVSANSVEEVKDSVNVIVEEAHPETDMLVAVDYSRPPQNPEYGEQPAAEQQIVHYGTVTDMAAVQGLVEAYNGHPPGVYALAHYSGSTG